MADAPQPLRIGIVGAGQNTRHRHIPGFRAEEAVEITCVANRTEESARKVAQEFGIPAVHADWRQVVESPEVDAVLVGTWPDMHCEVTLAALEAGKHVLCEARMARDLNEAKRMRAAAKEHKQLTAMLVPSPFGLEVGGLVKQLVDDHFIGDLREVLVLGVEDTFWDYTRPLHWRQERAKSGVNTLTLGILYETVRRWVPECERVFAQTQTFEPSRPDLKEGDFRDVDVPDSVHVLAELKGGVRANFMISGTSLFGPGKQIHLYGSRGTVVVEFDPEERVLAARAGDGELKPLDVPMDLAGKWDVEADFVAAVRGQKKVTLTDFATGVDYMEFTEAAFRSGQTGQPVELPPEA